MLNIDMNPMSCQATTPIAVPRTGSQISKSRKVLHKVINDQSGQILPWAVLLLLMFLGLSALVVDIGHALLIQRQLQASTDAAALAGARTLPDSSYMTVAQTFSAGVGGKNTYNGISVGTPSVAGRCLTTVKNWGFSCTSSSINPNAVSVTETATFPTFFAGVLGIKNLTVNAMSTASKGAKSQPYNVAIILDTTPSMNTPDPNCGGKTQLQCALEAFQYLLANLDPSMDRISLFTFPPVSSSSVTASDPAAGYSCSGSTRVEPYTFPSDSATSLSAMPYDSTTRRGGTRTVQTTYQITDFSTDYRSSDAATSLNTGSMLTEATGGGAGNCPGIQTSNNDTYLAGAIYAAQAALVAEQAANQGTMNAIILLSDGNATAQSQGNGGNFSPTVNDMVSSSSQSGGSGTYATTATSTGHPYAWSYPSWEGECGQEVDAANFASNYTYPSGTAKAGQADGTLFFTIAYGSPSTSSLGPSGGNTGNCGSDVNVSGVVSSAHPNISPCNAMQQMSTGWDSTPQDTSHFYSDYYAPGGDSGCQAADANNTTTNLKAIVKAITVTLTGARLIPNVTP